MRSIKRALVTGYNGFVGSHLSLALTERGVKVIGFSCTERKPFNYKEFPQNLLVPVVGDIRDKSILQDVFEKYRPNFCLHLAGSSTVEEGQKQPGQTFDINIKGAVNILELSRLYRLEKIIIASTSHVYGDNSSVPYKEDYFPQPSRPYETSKTCVDLIAQSYADTFNMPIEIPRFVNIYGPGDFNFTRLIPRIMRQIIMDGRVEIWGGDVIRDYLYIEDAVSAYLCLLEKHNSLKNKIVNFGKGEPLSVKQLVEKIIKISGQNIAIKIKKTSERKLEVEKQYLLIKKAYTTFGWRAKVPYIEGLRETFIWYKKYFKNSKYH